MATLNDLELFGPQHGIDAVVILVGPNGSGKSTFLRGLAEFYQDHNVIAVSNTPHDRFAFLRKIKRISVGRPIDRPDSIVKRAVEHSLENIDSSFYQISAIMEYCGYHPRFGFVFERNYNLSFDKLRTSMESFYVKLRNDDSILAGQPDLREELERALTFLQRCEFDVPIWIDASMSTLEFSRLREFSSVLKLEWLLQKYKVIGGIGVLLQPVNGRREIIQMRQASSGQLALISSLLFLIVEAGHQPLILVDEPENSLHPSWQREYVEKLMAAMIYRDATIIIATHAPLVVTGALSDRSRKVSVFRTNNGQPRRLKIVASASPSSIEEILWEAFEVVTPANHFVSEEIVRAISRFENNELPKNRVLKLINEMDEHSFEPRQKRFFEAVRALLDKVEASKAGVVDGGHDLA